MEHKFKSFQIKSVDEENGSISGYFSTYDKIPDSYGDIVKPGAFTDTIKARAESGHPFPLCWNHDLNQIIGYVKPEDIKDDEHGPLMTACFFNSALAQEKRELVKSGVIYQFSFAYDVVDFEEPSKEDLKDGILNVLTKLDLFEVSIVPIPANPRAEVTEIKSVSIDSNIVNLNPVSVDSVITADLKLKSGRRNSAKDEQVIKDVISALQALVNTEEPDEGKDEPEANVAAEEQKASNPEKEDLLVYIKNMTIEECEDE